MVPIPCLFPKPLPLTTTCWGLSAGDSFEPGLSGGRQKKTQTEIKKKKLGNDNKGWELMKILHEQNKK